MTEHNPFKNKRMLFMKSNVLNTRLPSNVFDAIIIVSTIEHIGLSAYGQDVLDDGGDLTAMKELARLLKPDGIIIVTTPYIGTEPFRITSFERNYNREALERLIKCFEVRREEYFYPWRRGKHIIWIRMDRREIDRRSFKDPGVACLHIQKRNPPELDEDLRAGNSIFEERDGGQVRFN